MNKAFRSIETITRGLESLVQSKYFATNFRVEVNCVNRRDIIGWIDESLETVKERYSASLDSLQTVSKLIVLMADRYITYLSLKNSIRHLYDMRAKAVNFAFVGYPEIKNKINAAKTQAMLLKKEELSKTISAENVLLFNALNDTEYTNYSDVIDYIQDTELADPMKKTLINKVTRITSGESLDIEKLDFFINKLDTMKASLRHKKKEAHKCMVLLGREIEELKAKCEKVWYTPPRECKNAPGHVPTPEERLKDYVGSLELDKLSLVVALLAQMNLFQVTTRDKVSGKEEELILNDTSRKTCLNYICRWTTGFKFYLKGSVEEVE